MSSRYLQCNTGPAFGTNLRFQLYALYQTVSPPPLSLGTVYQIPLPTASPWTWSFPVPTYVSGTLHVLPHGVPAPSICIPLAAASQTVTLGFNLQGPGYVPDARYLSVTVYAPGGLGPFSAI